MNKIYEDPEYQYNKIFKMFFNAIFNNIKNLILNQP